MLIKSNLLGVDYWFRNSSNEVVPQWKDLDSWEREVFIPQEMETDEQILKYVKNNYVDMLMNIAADLLPYYNLIRSYSFLSDRMKPDGTFIEHTHTVYFKTNTNEWYLICSTVKR